MLKIIAFINQKSKSNFKLMKMMNLILHDLSFKMKNESLQVKWSFIDKRWAFNQVWATFWKWVVHGCLTCHTCFLEVRHWPRSWPCTYRKWRDPTIRTTGNRKMLGKRFLCSCLECGCWTYHFFPMKWWVCSRIFCFEAKVRFWGRGLSYS